MSDTATTSATPAPAPAPASVPVTLEGLDLAALLCSRVCHDLISPVGAVVNGIEVMEDDADEQTKQFAIELIKKSATTASARLQFCRIAFGAAGSAGASIDTGDAESVARGMMEDDKTKLTWKLTRVLLPKNRVKLLLNLLLMAGGTIPRGGTLAVEGVGEGDTMGFKITSTGMNARIPQAAPGLVAGETGGNPVDAHAIQPFFTGLLARTCGMSVTLAPEGEAIVLTAR
jgi:histidine phosphotransferase ChpT